MTENDVKNEYFEWLYNLACRVNRPGAISFRKLLMYLHNTEFTYSIPMDENRALNGIELRWYFCRDELRYEPALDYLTGPCSVLEMMIALSFKCEEFMDDPDIGDRFAQWFWHMIVSLGLGGMDDQSFKKSKVRESVTRFLDRDYDPNGKGGLFTIEHCNRDLRDVEIWHQMCWYLDEYY